MPINPFATQEFLNAALSALGVAYVWGGTSLRGGGKAGVDCSGLVYSSMRYAGYRPPRDANSLYHWTQKISQQEAHIGDLVFWDRDVSGGPRGRGIIDHTGIYMGNGLVLSASSAANKVVLQKLWGTPMFGRITQAADQGRIDTPLGVYGTTLAQLSGMGKIPVAPAPGPEGMRSTDGDAIAAAMLTQAQGPGKLSKTASEKDIVDFINANYGMEARGFLMIPELRSALVAAAQAGAVGLRGLEYVYKTKWWQSRTKAQQSWDILVKTDPKEAADRVAKRKAILAPLWEQYGIDDNMDTVATNFERLEMNDAQLNILMAKSLQAESDRTGMDRYTKGAVTADHLQQIARQEYLTPIDRQTAERWAIKGVRTGEDVEQSWRSYLSSISSQRFGIDPASGVTPGDVLSPIKMSIADNLEVSQDSIDLLDPQYSDVMQVQTQDGKYRPMTASEATKWARSQESFKGTKKAEEATSSLAEALAKTFGKVG